jgi:hypothetical protein
MCPGSASAALPATTANMLTSYGPVTRRSRSTMLGCPTAKPRRSAAIPAVFESEWSATTLSSSRAPGTTDDPVKAAYSSSTTTSVCGADRASATIVSGGSRVPVGLLGLQTKNRRGRDSSRVRIVASG